MEKTAIKPASTEEVLLGEIRLMKLLHRLSGEVASGLGKWDTHGSIDFKAAAAMVEQSFANFTNVVQREYPTAEMPSNKSNDMLQVLDLMDCASDCSELYQEMVTYMVDYLSQIACARSKGVKIFFPKYRALFQLLIAQVRADINGGPGPVWFRQDSLWFRVPEESKA